MGFSAYFFEFLVTPNGTTTLEIIAWFVLYGLTLVVRRSCLSKREQVDDSATETTSIIPINNGITDGSGTLRRRRPQESHDGGMELPVSNSERDQVPSQTSSIIYFMQNVIFAYFLNVILFTLISLAMHQSILFIPNRCDNTSQEHCNYTFYFDKEYYLTNPSTNDTLHLIYIKGKGAINRPLLFSHGNSNNLAYETFVHEYQSFLLLGLDVYAWDYPGYGKSRLDPTSSMSLERFQDDAHFILHQVSLLSNTKIQEVVLWGFSMGGAISTSLAVHHSSRFLVLQFPPDRFDWIVKEGTKLTGWFSTLPQFKVLNLYDLLPSLKSPTCVYHLAAEKDVYVTFKRQKSLFSQLYFAVKTCSVFREIKYLGHNSNPFQDIFLSHELLLFLNPKTA